MADTVGTTETGTGTQAAPAAKGGKGKGGVPAAKAATPAAPAAVAAPFAAGTPARPDDATAVPSHDAGHADITVAGTRKAAEAAKAAEEEAAAGAASRTEAKSLDAVKAARRAKVAAAEADKAKGASGAAAPAAGKTDADATAAAAAKTDDAAKTDEQKAADAAKAAEEAEKAALAAKTKTVETEVPTEKLKEFTKLNRELRETTTELRTLKADVVPLADALKKAQVLAKAGKHYEAQTVLKPFGIDFDATAREVLQLEHDDKETDPKVKKLQSDLAVALEKLEKIEDGQTKTKKTTDDTAKAVATQQRKEWEERVIAQVTLAADEFPYLSKSDDFVREALAEADASYPIVVEKLKRNLTDEEKDNMLRWALDDAEKKHTARAKLYEKGERKPKVEPAAAAAAPAATAGTGAASTSPTTTDGGMRAGVTTVGKPFRKRTLAEIRSERRQSGGR